MASYIKLPEVPTNDPWKLPANPDPPSRAVKPNTVHAALLACLDAHPQGATLEQCQNAVDVMVRDQGLDRDKKKHRALTLMRWASVNRGIGYQCINGLITYTRR